MVKTGLRLRVAMYPPSKLFGHRTTLRVQMKMVLFSPSLLCVGGVWRGDRGNTFYPTPPLS